MSASVLESRQTPKTAIETMRAIVVRSFDAAPRVEEVKKPVACRRGGHEGVRAERTSAAPTASP